MQQSHRTFSHVKHRCRVPKLFRIWFGLSPVLRDMKLNRKKVHWIIRQNQKGVGTKEIARYMKVSRRRVQQIWKYFKETGHEPILGQNIGRPRKPYVKREAEIVREAYGHYRLGARMLEKVIKNSLSAGHIDWYEVGGSDIKVCIILDDASRKALAGGEFSNINTENSKLVLDQVVDRYWWLLPMRELIMDRGSEFGTHRVHENDIWNSSFKQHLDKYGIKPILGSVAHPQTNGKLERFFQEYKRHRCAFSSIDEFINWYNDRPHGSLEFERLETPEKAFRRKMPVEAYYAIGHRLFGL